MRTTSRLFASLLLATSLLPGPARAQFTQSGDQDDPGEQAAKIRVPGTSVLRQQADVVTGAIDAIARSRQINTGEQEGLDDEGAAFPGAGSVSGKGPGKRGGAAGQGTSGGAGSGRGPGARDVDFGGFEGDFGGPNNENGGGPGTAGGLNSSLGGFSGNSGGSRNSAADEIAIENAEIANGNPGSGGNSQKGNGSNSGGSGFDGLANSDGGGSKFDNSNRPNSQFGQGGQSGQGAGNNGNAGNAGKGGGKALSGGAGFERTGNSASQATNDPGNTNVSAGPNSGTAQGNSQQDDGGRDEASNRAPASDTSNQRNKNDNTTTPTQEQADNSDAGKDQDAEKSAGSAPDRPEDEGFSAASDPVGKAAAARRFKDLSSAKGQRDLLGEQRDAERTDNEGALEQAGARINPLTGEAVFKEPSSGGTSPLLREHVEISKKRKQGQ